ncbi:MAG: prepilin-type N-terminal cleavage/methylation domain-containing protein [Woeseiaceae bacterium]
MRSGRCVRHAAGFSIIELIVALAISATIAAGLMLWLQRPLEALQGSYARAAALDQAQRVVAQLQRELPDALPNSVRIGCGGGCLEFIPVVAYGDYRAGPPGDVLDFAAPDDRFDVLKSLAAPPAAGMQVVINNQNALPGGSLSAYSASANNNRAAVAAGSSAALIRIATKQFPAPSPNQRFYIVSTPVSYLCAPQPSGGTIRRYANYAIQSAQPANTALGDRLVGGVTGCTFALEQPDLVTLRVAAIGDGTEPVQFLAQVRMDYVP